MPVPSPQGNPGDCMGGSEQPLWKVPWPMGAMCRQAQGAAFQSSSASLGLLLYLKEPRINRHVICKYLRDNKEMNNSQHIFVKNKSYQANLISFYASLLGKGEAAVVISLSFRRAFNVVLFQSCHQQSLG